MHNFSLVLNASNEGTLPRLVANDDLLIVINDRTRAVIYCDGFFRNPSSLSHRCYALSYERKKWQSLFRCFARNMISDVLIG